MLVNAEEIVGIGFPADEGTKLAVYLLSNPNTTWDNLEINLKKCTPGLLISSFFNGFLQKIADIRPDVLPKARKTQWLTAFDFQLQNIKRWTKDFAPVSEQVSVR